MLDRSHRRTALMLLAAPPLLWAASRLVLAAPPGSAETVCAVAHVDVLPPFTREARELLRRHVADSGKDPGAVRVEVFEELARPNHTTLVSVWETRAAFEANAATDHARAFRAKLHPMLGSPFDERLHRPVP